MTRFEHLSKQLEPIIDMEIPETGMTPYRSKKMVATKPIIKIKPRFNWKWKHIFIINLAVFLLTSQGIILIGTSTINLPQFFDVNMVIFFLVSLISTAVIAIHVFDKNPGQETKWNKTLKANSYVKEIEDIIKLAEADTVTGGVALNATELLVIKNRLEYLK